MTQDAPRSEDLWTLRPSGFHRMRLTCWGAPRADGPPPALCVHAFSRNARDFDDLARDLAADRMVVCPDVLGRGRSDRLADPAGYAAPAYCGDMAAVVARIGAPRVDWIGTSMGGIVGMMTAAAANAPIRRLVLNDVGPFIPAAALQKIARYVGGDPRFPNADALEARMRDVYAPFGRGLPDDYWRRMTRHGAGAAPDGADLGLAYDPAIVTPMGDPDAIGDVDLWSVWDAIDRPVLVVRGADSALLSADTMAEMTRRGPGAVGRVQTLTVDGAGHAPSLADAPTRAAIRAFLAH